MALESRPRVSLILPAFNERQRIGHTIGEASTYSGSPRLSHEILVAADGTDGTREHVRELARTIPNLSVLGGPERRGKGHGIRQAVHQAVGAIIGFSDADNKTPIDDLDRVLPHFAAGADLVVGSRALSASRIERPQKLYRRLGSRGFRAVLQLILGLPGVSDTQCGFKFFRHDVARDLFARQIIDGYMFDVEILCLARRAGYGIVEVPVRWRDDGDSRLQLFSGNLRNVLDLLRIRFRRTSSRRPELISAPARKCA